MRVPSVGFLYLFASVVWMGAACAPVQDHPSRPSPHGKAVSPLSAQVNALGRFTPGRENEFSLNVLSTTAFASAHVQLIADVGFGTCQIKATSSITLIAHQNYDVRFFCSNPSSSHGGVTAVIQASNDEDASFATQARFDIAPQRKRSLAGTDVPAPVTRADGRALTVQRIR